MRRAILRRWRSISFTIRFAVVLGIMAVLVASVPLVVVAQQARTVAEGHVADQAQLVAALVQDQEAAIASYAKDIGVQLSAAGSSSAALMTAALIRDSSASTDGDLVGIAGTDNIFARGGAALAPGDPLAQAMAHAASAGSPVITDAAGRPWLVGVAPLAHGDVVITGRALRGNVIPEMVILRNSRVAISGPIGGVAQAEGATVDPVVTEAVTPVGRVGVVTLDGHLVAIASVDLGGGFIAVTSSQANAINNVDPTTLLLVALSLVALLLTVVVVQTDLHQPLRRLDRAAAALAEGDFDVPIPGTLGSDAVGRLAATFEVMRRRLRGTLHASRARAAIATELNTPQPLRAALQHVCVILRDTVGATDAVIVVAASEIGEPFAVSATTGSSRDAAAMLAADDPVGEAFRRRPGDAVEVGPLHRDDDAMDPERVAAVPISVGGTSLGVVALTGGDTEVLRESIDVMIATSDQVGFALERYRILSVIQRQASTDDLTGLYNHRFLVDYLGQQFAVAERQASSLTVLMLDVDHFKKLNDTYGHHAGDLGLQAFAQTITQTIRRSDLAARYGGEEFVVVMPDTTSAEAMLVAEKIRAAVAAMSLDIGGGHPPIGLTVSIGVATYPENTLLGRELIQLADQALYAAKGAGRDRVVRCDAVALAVSRPPRTRNKKKEPSPKGEGSPQR